MHVSAWAKFLSWLESSCYSVAGFTYCVLYFGLESYVQEANSVLSCCCWWHRSQTKLKHIILTTSYRTITSCHPRRKLRQWQNMHKAYIAHTCTVMWGLWDRFPLKHTYFCEFLMIHIIHINAKLALQRGFN